METPNGIKIIKNFMPKEHIDTFIDYINNNLDYFYVDPRSKTGKRYAYKFGKDAVHADSRHSLEDLVGIKDLVNLYAKKVCETSNAQFDDSSKLFLSSFWMAKQDPGAIVTYHKDTDQDNNLQFKYSGVLYLNSMPQHTGKLRFPELMFQYCPEEGDLIMFPSHGDEFTHGVDWIANERYSLAFWITADKDFELL
jgi:hypothetical protein